MRGQAVIRWLPRTRRSPTNGGKSAPAVSGWWYPISLVQEAGGGDPEAAKKRLRLLKPFPLLDATTEVEELADELLRKRILPRKKVMDALHIAVCTVHDTDYLVTWNCTHVPNAEMRTALAFVCGKAGYTCPVICTPEELMGAK